MGYTTEFKGSLEFDPPLPDDDRDLINAWCETRHDDTECPSTWCDWWMSACGARMEWSGSEKSYAMVEWANFLVERFVPAGTKVGGIVLARGEDFDDLWHMAVADDGRTVERHPVWPIVGVQEPVGDLPAVGHPSFPRCLTRW